MSDHHKSHPEYGAAGVFCGYGEFDEEKRMTPANADDLVERLRMVPPFSKVDCEKAARAIEEYRKSTGAYREEIDRLRSLLAAAEARLNQGTTEAPEQSSVTPAAENDVRPVEYDYDPKTGNIVLPASAPFDGNPVLIKLASGWCGAWWEPGSKSETQNGTEYEGFQWVCMDADFIAELDDAKFWTALPPSSGQPDNRTGEASAEEVIVPSSQSSGGGNG